ncbi:hypothetical protein ABH922_001077 [Rhodococcus sp. 27YEA15]|uniref:hypothetical protein n=1 Tax=Rhodococcus sp. 27YEA15 TaxID=3156259 RepID=UPI003C7A9D00
MCKPGEALKTNEFHNTYTKQMAGLLAQVDKRADSLAEEPDQQMSPAKRLERSIDNDSNEVSESPVAISARITKNGPKYALAVGPAGRRGRIPARSVHDIVGSTRQINVDTDLHIGDEIRVAVEETDDALYYHPTSIG